MIMTQKEDCRSWEHRVLGLQSDLVDVERKNHTLTAQLEAAKEELTNAVVHENDLIVRNKSLTSRAESAECKVAQMKEVLQSIQEYWNGAHDSAVDAAEVMRERAAESLSTLTSPIEQGLKTNQEKVLLCRVQLSRKKGWKMPPNTRKVDRSTWYGNPFTIESYGTAEAAVSEFRRILRFECLADELDQPAYDQRIRTIAIRLDLLKGKNLACWCKLGTPCHADVLLEAANYKP